MKIKILIVFAAIVVLLSAFGCAPPQAVNFEATYDEFMQGKNITWETNVNKGDTIVITLGSNPTTGYIWTEDANIDNSNIKQNKHEYIAPTGTSVVGASGKEVWTFTASNEGTTTIKMNYARPWESADKTEWTFIATINVK